MRFQIIKKNGLKKLVGWSKLCDENKERNSGKAKYVELGETEVMLNIKHSFYLFIYFDKNLK